MAAGAPGIPGSHRSILIGACLISPYVAATVRVMVTTLALGRTDLSRLPRQAGASRTQSGTPLARHLTGFDEEVQLGQLGEILENDSVVMTVAARGRERRPDPARARSRSGGASPCCSMKEGDGIRQTKGTQAVVSFKRDARLKTESSSASGSSSSRSTRRPCSASAPS